MCKSKYSEREMSPTIAFFQIAAASKREMKLNRLRIVCSPES